MGKRNSGGKEKMNSKDNLEKKITGGRRLKEDLKQYKPEILTGIILGAAAGIWRHYSDNPNYVSEIVPLLAGSFTLLKAIEFIYHHERGEKIRIERSLQDLKREVARNITGLGVFYGTYLL